MYNESCSDVAYTSVNTMLHDMEVEMFSECIQFMLIDMENESVVSSGWSGSLVDITNVSVSDCHNQAYTMSRFIHLLCNCKSTEVDWCFIHEKMKQKRIGGTKD